MITGTPRLWPNRRTLSTGRSSTAGFHGRALADALVARAAAHFRALAKSLRWAADSGAIDIKASVPEQRGRRNDAEAVEMPASHVGEP
ncbi:hypothetical protein, partial [Accumulibacter sp.]|uniref:hypothetical protein n=1 Tax=Accumulibacter sp. TaxID=2053492 RepID=UPI002D1FB7EC